MTIERFPILISRLCVWAALALSVSATARAQDVLDQDAAERRVDFARTLFTDGVQLVAQGRYPQAEERFRQALELHDAPAIRYNLASVLFEQNEYREAATHLRQVLDAPDAPPDIISHASDLSSQLNARAAWVRVEVVSGFAVVEIDDEVVHDISEEVALAPGEHTLTAHLDEREVARQTFAVESGDHRTLAIDPDTAAASSPSGPRPIEEEWWFWTAIAGGVIVLGVVIGVSVAVSSQSPGAEAPVQGNFQPGLIQW